jgi:hypothetical protein
MKINLFIASLIINLACFGQANVTNSSLTDSSVNIVYTNVINDMVIHGFRLDEDSRVIVYKAMITLTGPNTFSLKPAAGDSAIVTINKQGRMLYRKAFLIQPLPEPVAKFGKLSSITASVDEVLTRYNYFY